MESITSVRDPTDRVECETITTTPASQRDPARHPLVQESRPLGEAPRQRSGQAEVPPDELDFVKMPV